MKFRLGPRYAYWLTTYGVGIAVFTLFRLLNTWVYCSGSQGGCDFEGLYGHALWMGWRFDTVVSGYLLALPLLLMIVGEVAHIASRAYYRVVHWLMVALYVVAFFACAVDVPFFSYFFARLNATSINEIDSFGLILDMILSEPRYLWGLLAFVLLAVGYVLLMGLLYRRLLRDRVGEHLPTVSAVPLALVLVFATFVGMRGRLSKKSPIRVGTAYYCSNAFLNQLGLNPVFTFVKSIEEAHKSANADLAIMEADEAQQLYQQLRATPVDSTRVPAGLHLPLPEGTNVVLVIMESMTVDKTGLFHPERSLTPHLDSLMRSGLVFTQCYSAGIHTYNGIYSTLYSHPGILARHTMKHTFIPSMCGLPQQLQACGYQTTFMLTHDEDYDNMRGFLYFNAFDSVVGQHSYPSEEWVGTWGIPDHTLFEHAVRHCSEVAKQGPFFTTLMTCSDHVPYILPEGIDFVPRSKDMSDKMVEYADWSIGQFMRLAAQQPWFDSTLFVFIADHGAAGESHYDIALSYHHVPMLFYAPGRIEPQRLDRLALQIDLYPTLMGMLPYAYENNTFGLDLMRQRRDVAFFSSDDKICALDTAYLYICQVAENNEHLYHYCDTLKGDQLSLHPDRAAALRRYAFGMVQHSYNMISKHTTSCTH